MAIGWANDIAQYSLSDLVGWYRHYYGPNNAALVVVGDVDPAEVFRLAKKYFGRVRAINKVEQKHYSVPDQKVHRAVSMRVRAKVPQFWMAFPVPTFLENASEAYALDVLAGLLNGSSGLIAKALVRGKQQLTAGGASYDGAVRGDSLFTLSATPAPKPEPDLIQSGPILPPPSMFDERLLIETEASRPSIAAAFAMNNQGMQSQE